MGSLKVPRSKSNPVGQTKRVARARAAVFSDIRRARDALLAQWQSLPVRVINAPRYEYLVDIEVLRSIVEMVRTTLLTGQGIDEIRRNVRAAYRAGIAQAADNLSGLSDDYPRTVLTRLGEDFVTRRAALAAARTLEKMRGFSFETADDLARVLFEAVQAGESPAQTAKTIRERFAVSRTRAERIARTEITGALRRGRRDEARDAGEKFGLEIRLVHVSALIAGRTRRSHAARHGKIVTVDDQDDWYQQNGNSINCLCSSTEITVDPKTEKPLFGEKALQRMRDRRKSFMEAGV